VNYLYHYVSDNPSGFDNEIDIQKSIMLVRAQRSGMVQTEVSLYKQFLDFSCHYDRPSTSLST